MAASQRRSSEIRDEVERATPLIEEEICTGCVEMLNTSRSQTRAVESWLAVTSRRLSGLRTASDSGRS